MPPRAPESRRCLRRTFTQSRLRRSMGQLEQVAEQIVCVAFASVAGSGARDALTRRRDRRAALAPQATLAAAKAAVDTAGGALRQLGSMTGRGLLRTFGLPGSTYEDNAAALSSAFDVVDALELLHLRPRVGVTSGVTFCGVVGAPPLRVRGDGPVLSPRGSRRVRASRRQGAVQRRSARPPRAHRRRVPGVLVPCA